MSTTKKKSLVPLFGVAFIVAIVSTGIFYGLFVGRLNSAPSAGSGVIYVAAKSLPVGTVLKAEHLKELPWSAPSRPTGSIAKVDDAVGHTLVEPVAENELMTTSRIATKSGGAVEGGSMGIPDGMRAVSLQVQDSAGVVALLKSGHRVDVQVVATVPGQFNNEPQIRTVLENMTVLTASKDPVLQRGSTSIVTVLATPHDATILGLADSTAKIRIDLRNPIDQKKENLGAVGLGSIFRPGSQGQAVAQQVSPKPPIRQQTPQQAPQQAPQQTQQQVQQQALQQIQLLVRVAGAGGDAVRAMEAQLDGAAHGESLQVAAFRLNAPVEATMERMQVLSTSRVSSAQKREAGTQWSIEDPSKSCGLRIQFTSSLQSSGKVLVRVHPEVTTPAQGGTSFRRVDTEVEVADGQSFLVRGFASPENVAMLWEKLFPGRQPGGASQELLVVVTPKVIRSMPLSSPPTV